MEKHPQIGASYDCLTPIELSEQVGSKRYWLCLCSCGNTRLAEEARLKPGVRNWCRCAQIAATKIKNSSHGYARGHRKHPLYTVWRAMRSRCENHRTRSYPDYGGRGITVCDRWRHGDGSRSGFECFLADMGTKPSPAHTIERLDNDLPYAPENCVWATRKAQSRNRRNVYRIPIDGRDMTLSEAADHYGISMKSVQSRLRYGWDIHRALTHPIDLNRGRR